MEAVIATLELNAPVIVSPSMSGGYSLPYLFKSMFCVVIIILYFIILYENLINLSAVYHLNLTNKAQNSANTRKTLPIWQKSANTRFSQSGFGEKLGLQPQANTAV